jgi:iron complex transport system ATP-binding protein
MSLLEVRGAYFRYSAERYIFRDVNFSLDAGRILSIIGPNGSGKSTLLNCLAGLSRLNSGEIILDGKNQRNMKPREAAKVIGYVPQVHTPVYGYTVRDFVVMGQAPYIGTFASPGDREYEIAERAIASMGITRLSDRPYTEISGGERQQATIARVLAQQPKIIMMDEPTSSLDYGNQMKALSVLRDLAAAGKGIVFTSHDPGHALLLGAKVAAIRAKGDVSIGAAQDVVTKDMAEALYGVRAEIVEVYDEAKGNHVKVFAPFLD